jgi:hypothetical protein
MENRFVVVKIKAEKNLDTSQKKKHMHRIYFLQVNTAHKGGRALGT